MEMHFVVTFLWWWDLGRMQVPLRLGCSARLLGKVVMIVISIEHGGEDHDEH